MIPKNPQNYKTPIERILGFLSILWIFCFLLIASGCPFQKSSTPNKDRIQQEGSSSHSSTKESPTGMPAPTWTQTEYVFQNKTNGQISIIEPGKSKIVLNTNECVYIEHLTFHLANRQIAKAGAGLICGNPCSNPYERCEYVNCSDKLKAAGYGVSKSNKDSQMPYLEIYNIVDTDHIFKTGMDSPIPINSSQKTYWKDRCKSP